MNSAEMNTEIRMERKVELLRGFDNMNQRARILKMISVIGFERNKIRK